MTANQVHIKIWNSKSGNNIYSKFKTKYGVLHNVNFGKLYIISKL